MKIFAYSDPDLSTLLKASSGGISTLIANRVIEAGGVVYGVAFSNDWGIEHIRISDKGEINSIIGSKYAFSKWGNCIPQIECDLKNGSQVAFIGTPCQVAAISKKFREYENLLLIEVVCHGAPEQKYWISYLDAICRKYKTDRRHITGINFRDKRTGWRNYSFTIHFDNRKSLSQHHDDNLYIRAFLQNLTLRNACFKCTFKYPQGSYADITIGDFWGIDKIYPNLQNPLGTSLLIARTRKAGIFTRDLTGEIPVKISEICKYNTAISCAADIPNNRNLFIKRFSDTNDKLQVLNKYAGETFLRKLYLRLARIKNYILQYGTRN